MKLGSSTLVCIVSIAYAQRGDNRPETVGDDEGRNRPGVDGNGDLIVDGGGNYVAANPAAEFTDTVATCWKCSASSYQDCIDNGVVETCNTVRTRFGTDIGTDHCYLKEIKRYNFREGGMVVQHVATGCMEKRACDIQKKGNFEGSLTTLNKYRYSRCRPEGRFSHSECYQCCFDKDMCIYEEDNSGNVITEMWEPSFIREWDFSRR